MKFRMISVVAVAVFLALTIAVVRPVLAQSPTTEPDTWTSKDVKQAILNMKTAEDHERIAEYYRHDAARLDQESKDHAEMAAAYRRNPTGAEQKLPGSGRTARHCDWLSQQYALMAQTELKLATDHDRMAKDASLMKAPPNVGK